MEGVQNAVEFDISIKIMSQKIFFLKRREKSGLVKCGYPVEDGVTVSSLLFL